MKKESKGRKKRSEKIETEKNWIEIRNTEFRIRNQNVFKC